MWLNTGILTGCLSCTIHQGECSQKEYADGWKQFCLILGKEIDLTSINTLDWFKAVSTEHRSVNEGFMQFEGDVEEDIDTIHCDELEEEEECNETSQEEHNEKQLLPKEVGHKNSDVID